MANLGAFKDLTHNFDYKSSDENIPLCEGDIAIMNQSIITSTCSRLCPTDKLIDVCMDPKDAMLFLVCGCHRNIIAEEYKSYPNHAASFIWLILFSAKLFLISDDL